MMHTLFHNNHHGSQLDRHCESILVLQQKFQSGLLPVQNQVGHLIFTLHNVQILISISNH